MLHAKSLLNGFFQELIFSHCHADKVTNGSNNRKLKIRDLCKTGVAASRQRAAHFNLLEKCGGLPTAATMKGSFSEVSIHFSYLLKKTARVLARAVPRPSGAYVTRRNTSRLRASRFGAASRILSAP